MASDRLKAMRQEQNRRRTERGMQRSQMMNQRKQAANTAYMQRYANLQGAKAGGVSDTWERRALVKAMPEETLGAISHGETKRQYVDNERRHEYVTGQLQNERITAESPEKVARLGADSNNYVAGLNLQGIKHQADTKFQGAKYSADKVLEGQKYTSDGVLEGVYDTNRANRQIAEGEAASEAARLKQANALEQMRIKASIDVPALTPGHNTEWGYMPGQKWVNPLTGEEHKADKDMDEWLSRVAEQEAGEGASLEEIQEAYIEARKKYATR